MIQSQACDNALNSSFLFLHRMSGIQLCSQQKHHQSLWSDLKSLSHWPGSEPLPLAGEQGENALSDWLGLDTVDDGVEHGRHEEVDARRESVDQG